jgi:hypothetical protein
MSEHDHVPAGEPVRALRQFLKLLHHGARRRQEGARERIGITFLARVLRLVRSSPYALMPH